MKLLSGTEVARQIGQQIRTEVDEMTTQGQRPPHLKVIMVGHNPASESYVKNEERHAKKLGIQTSIERYAETMTQKGLMERIGQINADSNIDGLIVQLPLPAHMNARLITDHISPSKDVDGFHAANLGQIMLGLPGFRPATPMGILLMIQHLGIQTEGKHVVVLGRSSIVGLPLANMLVQKKNPGNSTVTVCHSKTENLSDILRLADILIVAMGVPEFVKADMVKPGAVVIDVGINRVDDPTSEKGWSLKGDVDFEDVSRVAGALTPVPGGVGPMTIMALMLNTLEARKRTNY